MGKKKSVVLIILVTVVLAGLLFLSVTPSFYVSTAQKFNSLLSIVDFGSDLGGGYYTVYYPEGVISRSEYDMLVEEYEETKATPETNDDVDDPAEHYFRKGGIYLSETVCDAEGNVTETFQAEFESAFNAIKSRFEQKNFIDHSVKKQDGYTIRVEVPYTDESVDTLFESFAFSGSLIFSDTDTSTEKKNVLMSGTTEYIKGASVANAGDSGYAVAIRFTKEGRAKFAEITGDLVSAASSDSSSSGSTSSATLYMYVGTENLMSATLSEALDQDTVYISGNYSTRESAETIACVINSTLDEDNVFNIRLDTSDINEFAPTMGEHAALGAAIAIGVLVLAMIVFSLVRYKGMGLAHVYGFLTYALLLILCISLIGGIVLNAGGLLAIVLSAAVMTSFNWYAFANIRSEFASGKTLTASVKAGYKKSLALTIDVHIVLAVLSAILYLISLGTVRYMSLIFLLGTVISAACTLAVTRFYLYMFLAQPKNKIAFCNFKREETEDE